MQHKTTWARIVSKLFHRILKNTPHKDFILHKITKEADNQWRKKECSRDLILNSHEKTVSMVM